MNNDVGPAQINWLRYAEIATGILGWSPDMFWSATLPEFMTALRGWKSVNSEGGETPLSMGEMSNLKQKFPDH